MSKKSFLLALFVVIGVCSSGIKASNAACGGSVASGAANELSRVAGSVNKVQNQEDKKSKTQRKKGERLGRIDFDKQVAEMEKVFAIEARKNQAIVLAKVEEVKKMQAKMVEFDQSCQKAISVLKQGNQELEAQNKVLRDVNEGLRDQKRKLEDLFDEKVAAYKKLEESFNAFRAMSDKKYKEELDVCEMRVQVFEEEKEAALGRAERAESELAAARSELDSVDVRSLRKRLTDEQRYNAGLEKDNKELLSAVVQQLPEKKSAEKSELVRRVRKIVVGFFVLGGLVGAVGVVVITKFLLYNGNKI